MPLSSLPTEILERMFTYVALDAHDFDAEIGPHHLAYLLHGNSFAVEPTWALFPSLLACDRQIYPAVKAVLYRYVKVPSFDRAMQFYEAVGADEALARACRRLDISVEECEQARALTTVPGVALLLELLPGLRTLTLPMGISQVVWSKQSLFHSLSTAITNLRHLQHLYIGATVSTLGPEWPVNALHPDPYRRIAGERTLSWADICDLDEDALPKLRSFTLAGNIGIVGSPLPRLPPSFVAILSHLGFDGPVISCGDLAEVLEQAINLVSLSLDFTYHSDMSNFCIADVDFRPNRSLSAALYPLATKAIPLRCLHIRGGSLDGQQGADEAFISSLPSGLLDDLYSLVIQGPLIDQDGMYRLGGGTLRALYVRQYAPPIDPMTGLTARHLFRVLRNQLTALELMSDLRSPWLTEGDESYGIITDWCQDNGVRTGWNGSVSSDMLIRWEAEHRALLAAET